MALTIGTELGSHKITALLGKGGMGEVYRARDTKLKRDVAIKILPAEFSRDPERVSRFQREAEVLASLNHPSISAIYDLQEANGLRYLVLELVEGDTLADKLERGPLSVEEALKVAKSICEALEAAHEKGIVHRDLKPANVKITPDGKVKILDFGLAKVPGGVSASVTADSPTNIATHSGVILGTAAYMAPEQVRGREVDKRADIWAFGVLLYELLTGRRPFHSEDFAGTLAMVLKEQPDLSDIPPEVRPLLAKCLEKDPGRRLRDIADFELLLGMLMPAPAVQAVPARWPWIAAAVGGAVAAAACAYLWLHQPASQAQHIQFSLEPPPGTQFNNGPNAMTPSPDGRYIVFGAGDSRDTSVLWLRSLDELTARPLPGTDGGSFTFWSPDSKSLAFTAGGKLKRIAIAGGPAVTLADSSGAPVTPIGSWSPSGVILFGSGKGLWRVNASGGESTLLTKTDPDRKEAGHGFPQFLPDGKRFLYFVQSPDLEVRGVYVSSLESPERRQRILRTSSKAFYAPPHAGYGGYLVWLQEQTLLAQRFDADKLRLEGEPVAIADNIALGQVGPVRAAYCVSDAGLLVYFGGAELEQRRIVWMSRDGRQLGDIVPRDRFGSLALSHDGQQLAFERTVQETRGATAKPDLWLWSFDSKRMTKLTFDNQRDLYPIWSPDGGQVAFISDREGITQIYRKNASGTGEEVRLTNHPNGKITMDWSRDGRYILYRQMGEKTGMDMWVLPLAGPDALKPFAVLESQFNEGGGRFSPDGKWFAYDSNETGVNQIFVRAFPPSASGSGEKWQISQNGGQDVRWRGDGRELYWVTSEGKIFAADIMTSPRGLQSGTPHELFTAPIYTATAGSYDVAPDGQRFVLLLFASQAEGSIRLNVVANWQAGLAK